MADEDNFSEYLGWPTATAIIAFLLLLGWIVFWLANCPIEQQRAEHQHAIELQEGP